jgi:hypothetical protein
MGTRVKVAGKHTMKGAIDAQRRYARKHIEQWCKDMLKEERYICDPVKVMGVLVERLWALYCQEFEPEIRWSTIHGNTWEKHNRELIAFIEKYTAYRHLWEPITSRHHILFTQAMKNAITWTEYSNTLKKEFLKS